MNQEMNNSNINNQSYYVREIQKYLRLLAQFDNDMTPIIPDGIYGPETRREVEKFQRLQGIPVTGTVDFVTWNILYNEYKKALLFAEQANYILPFNQIGQGEAVSPRDTGNIVYIIQIMLETLGTVYKELVGQPINGVYDGTTEKNVREFQIRNNLDPTGVVDKITWNRLADGYNMQIKNLNY